MNQLLRDVLWVYVGVGQPRPDVHRVSSEAPAGARYLGAAWAVTSGAVLVGACLWVASVAPPELATPCPMGRLALLGALLAGSPLLAYPRVGLELAKAVGCGVPAARLSVIATATTWWTLTAVVAYYLAFPGKP